MTDRELLELAAKAAGIVGVWVENFGPADDEGILYEHEHGGQSVWNPRDNNGDALWLAVKLELRVEVEGLWAIVWDARNARRFKGEISERIGTAPCAATRRAIVRAAAEIGAAQ